MKMFSIEEKRWYTGVGEDSKESWAVRCHEKAEGSRADGVEPVLCHSSVTTCQHIFRMSPNIA